MATENQPLNSENLAGRYFRPEDDQDLSEIASGLAKTHEQVNDTLMEGTIDGKRVQLNGEEHSQPSKRYEEEL
ncbi:MAG: YozQ family protein [Bacillales bacterium]|nr:YozQ family protein [Bacillales bacterium]